MFQIGQVLKGRLGSYKLTEQLENAVWLAVNERIQQKVIVKHCDHWRIRHERDMLRQFQDRTQHIRPLLDEIELDNGSKSPALVLKWLETHILRTSINRQLTPKELKRVGYGVLKALEVIHGDGYVHTDVKPTNVLANYDSASNEITDVQLADLDSTVHEGSKQAKEGQSMGTPLFRSPEAILQMRWGKPTDIWSFGAMMIHLVYGGDFNILQPDVRVEHDDYHTKLLIKQNQFFGPFPLFYEEIADGDRLEALTWVIENTNKEYLPFQDITTKEISKEDNCFLLKIMKLDPRDRPTVTELLADEWFSNTEAVQEGVSL